MYKPHERVQSHPIGESLTQQNQTDECDINVLMERYERNEMMEHVNKHPGGYGDYSTAPDYHTAMNLVLEADDMFMTVPAKVRKKFNNDPAEFLEFVQDPTNLAEMRELGLSEPAPAPASVPETPETPPEGS